tara:strand:- start:169 stop:393 length:225 start_codon:yes stop_codon:yes gene_type:complete
MTNQDILMSESMGTIVELSHECKVYNGIFSDEEFRIERIVGDFEQVIVINQYSQEFKINPNEIVDLEVTKNYNY